jgi:hypothetical protein
VREPKIGEAPAMKAETARAIASDWAAQVRLGGDPSGQRQGYREAPTMAALFDRYLSDHARPNKKASSLTEDERLIKAYLKPGFARRKVAEVKRADIDKFHKSLSGRPYLANRSLALLSKSFNLAEMWGWRADASNPCRHVKKFAETKRRRFLSPTELARLGEVLRIAERDFALVLGRHRHPGRPSLRVSISIPNRQETSSLFLDRSSRTGLPMDAQGRLVDQPFESHSLLRGTLMIAKADQAGCEGGAIPSALPLVTTKPALASRSRMTSA